MANKRDDVPKSKRKNTRQQLESAVETLGQASVALHEAARIQRRLADDLSAKAEECRLLMHHLDEEREASDKR